MLILDPEQARIVRSVCEAIVPGCARTGAEVYVDALLARMEPDARGEAIAAFRTLGPPATEGGAALDAHAPTPQFQLVRALACEAFYSDFVAPDASGPGAWQEIGFAPPAAARLDKDWSYLGVGS